MNKKLLKQYLENPNLLSPSDTKKLSVLVEDYPYFQTARMLYTKGLQVNEDEKFEQLLSLAATYAASRAKLLELLSPEQVDVTLHTVSQEEKQSEETQRVEKKSAENAKEQEVSVIQPIQPKEDKKQESTEHCLAAETVPESVEEIELLVSEPTTEEITPNVVQEQEEQKSIEKAFEEIIPENSEEVEPLAVETNIPETTVEAEVFETTIEEQVSEVVQDIEEHEKEEIVRGNTELTETPNIETIISEPTSEDPSCEVVEHIEEHEVEKLLQPIKKEESVQEESLADMILRKYRAMKEQEGTAVPTEEKQSLIKPQIIENEIVMNEVVPQKTEEHSEVVEQVIEEQNNVVAEVVRQETEEVSEIVEQNIEEQNEIIEETVRETVENDHIEKEIVEGIDGQTENTLLEFSFTDSERSENEIVVSEGKTEVSSIDFSGLFNENTPLNDEIVQSNNEPEKIEAQKEIQVSLQPVEEFELENSEPVEASAPKEITVREEPELHDWFEKSETKPDTTRMDLIDKFICDDPQMPKLDNTIIRANAKDVEDLSKTASNDCECITESMAKIYIKQELFDKAIDIYQKLILKYPEKSVYFADRIKKVQELKNKGLW